MSRRLLGTDFTRETIDVTERKLARFNAPAGTSAPSARRRLPWLDWAARASVVIIYGGFAFLAGASLPRLLPLDDVHKLLMFAAGLANVLFLGLVALITLTRLMPVRKSRGIEARIAALLGAFPSIVLAFLPRVELGPLWSVVSTTLILVGVCLCIVVLRRLGRSFSILAEARRLVTDGPYSLVRHPLYFCEAIALAGITLQVLSPLAVLISGAIVAVQCRRMIHEERVLTQAFPEYEAYAARVPFLIPRFGRSRRDEIDSPGAQP